MDRPFAHAIRRFGFGATLSNGTPPRDAHQWLEAQLEASDSLLQSLVPLSSAPL
jgi:hypothetical protein